MIVPALRRTDTPVTSVLAGPDTIPLAEGEFTELFRELDLTGQGRAFNAFLEGQWQRVAVALPVLDTPDPTYYLILGVNKQATLVEIESDTGVNLAGSTPVMLGPHASTDDAVRAALEVTVGLADTVNLHPAHLRVRWSTVGQGPAPDARRPAGCPRGQGRGKTARHARAAIGNPRGTGLPGAAGGSGGTAAGVLSTAC